MSLKDGFHSVLVYKVSAIPKALNYILLTSTYQKSSVQYVDRVNNVGRMALITYV
jgi:uncharacterized membrane protein YeiB